MARYNVDLQDNEGNAYQIMANPDSVAEFSPAVNRENIRSGETYRVIFGKIMKYLSELGNAAYVGLANNCTTTIAGFALDARQGKELMDRINELNRDLGGCSLEQDGVDFYIVGADAVRKKLTGNDIYEIAYNEGNGWAGKGTIQLDVTNIPDYATLSLDSFKYVALLSSSGTGGATEEITGSYMGVKVLGYDSGSGKLSIQTANAYRPIFIVVIE